MLTTRSRVVPETRPSSSLLARSFRAATGLVTSVSARRTPSSRSSRPVTANSSSPSAAAPDGSASAAVSRSRAAASDARLGPLICLPPSRARGCSSGGAFALVLQVVKEALDDAPLPGLIGQRLAHDAPGEVYRERADLGLERAERLLAVRFDLRVRRVDEAASLGVRLLAHLGDDLRSLLPCLLAQPGGLVPRLGQFLAVLGEGAVRLGLGFLGPLQAALDPVGPFRKRLVEPGQQELPEHDEDDSERDRADNELGQVGNQRVLQLFGRNGRHGGYPSVWVLLDEERDSDADQRQRLSQREADPHVRGDPA